MPVALEGYNVIFYSNSIHYDLYCVFDKKSVTVYRDSRRMMGKFPLRSVGIPYTWANVLRMYLQTSKELAADAQIVSLNVTPLRPKMFADLTGKIARLGSKKEKNPTEIEMLHTDLIIDPGYDC
jgi:hypothetical protein